MEKKKYVFNLKGEISMVSAFDKQEAFMQARLMGYDGGIKDIREY